MAEPDKPPVLEKLDKGTYKNSKIVNMGGVPFTVRDLVMKAPLISGLNVYLVGATGEGKSQLAHDLAGYLGDSYCYALGRPDFEPSELLKQVRLDKLKCVKTDGELIELTENVKKTLFYVDELNRCPPIVQNYFFDFFDGKLVHNGKIIPLGTRGYSLGFASGNIGNGAYVGVSDSDRALKDRMHIILKLDYPDFQTTELDDMDIFSGKKNPRASLPEKKESCLDELVAFHKEFGKRKVPSIIPLLGVYFHKGLDYLENTEKHSKRAVDSRWPRMEGIRADTDETAIFPLSKRAVFAAISLSQALETITESNGQQVESSVPMFLDSLRLTIPYSGVLAESFVNNEHGGDVYAALDAVMQRNREQINKKLPYLEEALILAEAGKKETSLLNEVASQTEGKWVPVKNAISSYVDYRIENPSDEGMEIAKVLEQVKNPQKTPKNNNI